MTENGNGAPPLPSACLALWDAGPAETLGVGREHHLSAPDRWGVSYKPRWSRHGDLLVIRAPRYLNRRAAREIITVTRRLMDPDGGSLLLDFQGCELVNHQGVTALFELEEMVGKLEGSISFRGMSAAVETVLRIMGLYRPA